MVGGGEGRCLIDVFVSAATAHCLTARCLAGLLVAEHYRKIDRRLLYCQYTSYTSMHACLVRMHAAPEGLYSYWFLVVIYQRVRINLAALRPAAVELLQQ